MEAVTRATLFASGSRRATLELAIRTDLHDRTQPPSSSPAFRMAPPCCARLRAARWGGARGGARGGPSPLRARPWPGPLLPLSAGPPRGEQAVVAGAPCRRVAAAPRSPCSALAGVGQCCASRFPEEPTALLEPLALHLPHLLPTSFFGGQGVELWVGCFCFPEIQDGPSLKKSGSKYSP